MGLNPMPSSTGEGPEATPKHRVEAAAAATAAAEAAAAEKVAAEKAATAAAAIAAEAAATDTSPQQADSQAAAAPPATYAPPPEPAAQTNLPQAAPPAASAKPAVTATPAQMPPAAPVAATVASVPAAESKTDPSDATAVAAGQGGGGTSGSMLEPDRPGESLRDAFARRLAAGGKDGQTDEQLMAQIEWDLKQLEARTDTLNQRLPEMIEYSKSLSPPKKDTKLKAASKQTLSQGALSQLEQMRLKRLGQLQEGGRQGGAQAGNGALRAGALGQGDEFEQWLRQAETMLKQCIDYSELGMMLMVRLDGLTDRSARSADPLLLDSAEASSAQALTMRRKRIVQQVQVLVEQTDANRSKLLARVEQLRPAVALPKKVADGAGRAWRRLFDSGLVKAAVVTAVAVGAWQGIAAAGGLEMAAFLGVHSVLNAVDIAGEEVLRYQRAWFPSLEQHRASKVVGVQVWEAEEAAYTHAVVQWKRDLRRYERDVRIAPCPLGVQHAHAPFIA